MIDAILDAIQSLSQRLARQEARPYNPYLPDAEIFDHFAGDGTLDARWTATVAGSGAVTLPNATPTLCRLSTGATIGSTAEIGWSTRYAMVGANKFATAIARYAITSAVDNITVVNLRFITATGDVAQVGVRGVDSTTFFSCRTASGGVPTTTVTTVPIDTDQHLFGVYMFPDRVRFYIDNALVAEHTTNIPTAAVQPRLTANNVTTGADRTMDADFIWVREAR